MSIQGFFNFRLYAKMLVLFLGVSFLSGCFIHPSNYGEYKPSREVGRRFENDKVPPDYTYYIAGTFSRPEALIGIAPGYTLNNKLWTRVNPDQLKLLTENMSIRAGYAPVFYGSDIVGPKGKLIGIYYSRWLGGPIVMQSDNQVNVNLPNVQEEQRPLFERK